MNNQNTTPPAPIDPIDECVRLGNKLAAVELQHREMRTLLLRIHSARVGMNERAVIAALDDVDACFREPNTN